LKDKRSRKVGFKFCYKTHVLIQTAEVMYV